MSRIAELDGVRGTAILIVIIYHWFIVESGKFLPKPLLDFGMLGFSGVDLFFVLSGFLIGGLLMDAKGAENYFKVFYYRRLCRILPLYILVLILTVPLYYSALNHLWLFADPLPWWSYLIFAQNFVMAVQETLGSRAIDATWSLAVEEQFYLTLPFIIHYFKIKTLPVIFILAIISAPLVRIALYLFVEQSAVANYVLLPCRMDSLFLGALGAWVIRNDIKIKHLYFYAAILFLGLILLSQLNAGFNSFLLISAGYTWIALFYFSLLMIAVTKKESLIAGIFRLKFLTFIGAIAYGLYLLHQPILGILHSILRDSTPYLNERTAFFTTFIAGIILIVLAYLSWHYFEKPFLKIGTRYRFEKPDED